MSWQDREYEQHEGSDRLRYRLAGAATWLYDLHLRGLPKMARGVLSALLAEVRWCAGPGAGAEAEATDAIARLHRLLRANLSANQHLPNLAAMTGLSPTHLNRLYKARYGCTPMGDLRRLRLEAALAGALSRVGAALRDYVLLPTFGEPPYYRLAGEWESPSAAGPDLARAVDAELFRLNILYEKRRREGTLGPVRWRELPEGFFEDFLRYRVSEEGAHHTQVKIPHLNPGESFLKFLAQRLPEPQPS